MKWFVYTVCAVAVLSAAVVITFVYTEFARRDRIELSCRHASGSTSELDPQAFDVRLIGDSWIADDVMDAGFVEAAKASLTDAVVSSEGIGGARSKLIGSLLQNAVATHEAEQPGRSLVIVTDGGINDKLANLGAGYYVAHMKSIVDAGLRCGATVAVISIPPFDKYITKRSMLNLIRWRIYAMISGDRPDSDAAGYNLALAEALKDEIATGRVLLIDSNRYVRREEIAARYQDGIHLKPEEMARFSRSVATELFAWLAAK